MKEQELIDEIMDWFDFGKVAKVMETLEWKWANLDIGFYIPVESEIRNIARKNLTKAVKYGKGQGRRYVISTGGFTYTYDPQDSELTLDFNVCSHSAFPRQDNLFQ